MRKVVGAILLLGSIALGYGFATWNLPAGTAPAASLETIGKRYPHDAALLLGAAWAFGLGLYFLVTRPVGADSGTFDPAGRFIAPRTATGPSGPAFLVQSLLMVSLLATAFLGAFIRHPGPLPAVLAATAILQAAVGLFLFILALFDRPRSASAIILGTTFYIVGIGSVVLVLVSGTPG